MYIYVGVPDGRSRRYLEAGATKPSTRIRVWFNSSIYMYYFMLILSSLVDPRDQY